MIRSAVDLEMHIEGGIVCIHAHIYTDTIKRSSELQKEIDEYLHSLYKRLKSEGKIIPFSLSNTPEEIG